MNQAQHNFSRTAGLLLAAAVALGATSLGGCAATTGKKFETQDVAFLTKHKTTKAEVIQKLGNPMSNSIDSNGVETLAWGYGKSSVSPMMLIPVVGGMLGGLDSESTTLVARFDRKGVLIDHEVNNSSSSSRKAF